MNDIFLRRSVRKYDLNKKIAYGDLVEVVKAGFYAPSAKNQQNREYMIIDDDKLMEKLSNSETGTIQLKNCNTLIVLLGENNDALLTRPSMHPIDLALASENIMLYAKNKGYGTCYIGGYPVKERMEPLAKLLDLPANKFVFCLIAIGYPLEADAFKDALRYDETKVHHNRY